MIVISYDPPDEEAQKWEIAEDSWTVGEMKLIEKHFGGTRPEFFKEVGQGSDTAKALLLWVVRLRTEPTLALGDLDDLKVPYLAFLQVFDAEEPDAVTDPKDMPSESAPAKTSSSKE
jgi:hypothetical protein